MKMQNKESVELTILMPCLNEEKTIGECIRQARQFLDRSKITGEILIADNGSSDKSVEIAKAAGARVVTEAEKGYGMALRRGLASAKGKYIILGDCDLTYDFLNLNDFLLAFNQGYDIIIGNRLHVVLDFKVMSLSHQIGVRFLSFIGRKRYGIEVRDFHCGLRGISRSALERVDFSTSGMEFATEFLAKGARAGLKIKQIPVTLHASVKGRKSHLRTIPDGIRHLRFMMNS